MKPFLLTLCSLTAAAAALSSCQDHDPFPAASYPLRATAASPRMLATVQGELTDNLPVRVMQGGYGSALAADPADPTIFYLLTDRGPNVDGPLKDSKVFPLPGFTPQIGRFRLEGDSLRLLESLPLRDDAGRPLTGLPNPDGQGGTGEVALGLDGNVLSPDPNGIDSEGLVRMRDGSFWISDEYGPHLLHVDASGRTLARINPFQATGGLPRVLATRRPNRGMEGLALTPDGRTLVGIMQSPLYNPGKDAVANSQVLRIVTYDLATAATRQYVYLLDSKSLRVSEIAAITATTFLVLERDEDPLTPGKKPPVKLLYKIDLADATDISDPDNSPSGRLYGGKTPEQLSPAELTAAGLRPVRKQLTLNLLQAVPTYPHDKAEGLAILSPTLIALSNDDDFGVTEAKGKLVPKSLPATGQTDYNSVYFIRLSQPLR